MTNGITGITGIIVFSCYTAWDSQRGGKNGKWKRSKRCQVVGQMNPITDHATLMDCEKHFRNSMVI